MVCQCLCVMGCVQESSISVAGSDSLESEKGFFFKKVGATGKALKNVVAIGIGGSFLGPLFVHTALQIGWMITASLFSSNSTRIGFLFGLTHNTHVCTHTHMQ